MKLLQRLIPALALLLAAAVAHASPITYNFNGDVSVSGTPSAIVGSFTLDAVTEQISAFSFSSGGSTFDNTTPNANAAATLDDGGGQLVIVSFTLPTGGAGILLDFPTLPGPLNLNPFSVSGISHTSGVYVDNGSGANATEYAFTSGSASLVTPEPPSLALFAGGILLLGLLWRRRFA